MSVPDIIDLLQKQVIRWRKEEADIRKAFGDGFGAWNDGAATAYCKCADDLDDRIEEIWDDQEGNIS